MILGACATGDQVAEVTSMAPVESTLSPGPGDPQDGAVLAGSRTITLAVDEEARSYTLFVPAGLEGKPASLIVDLHGLSESADKEEARSGMRRKAMEEGFVVVQPEGRSALKYWESSAAAAAVTGDVAFCAPSWTT